ncbi:hypothetical protein GUITHDRAFT_122423 [Guillardia theta CCMP2712]|uniref:GYF domain-containing protein n=2 Tax=Guillardia theta TaxID=55529 RepID=L1I576_GUITC|nr:hypothetical protein GUITHDRAFT_122423 [Guillardia theta CCMP2712]EKX31376.1 hypothetical protein GUITHDRAFT_122423 [Guillardia theta CCMP2712]|eukprot:XP_005818356.1 hypothetical protein GUITHDRAFT_122423 [Guillardia theta CCMP2712]
MARQGGMTSKEVGQHSLDLSGASDVDRNGLDSPRQLVYSKEELMALRPRTSRGARFKGEGLPHGFYSKDALQPVVLSGPMPPLRNVHPPARKDPQLKPFGRGRREDMEGFGGPVPAAYRQQGPFGGGFAGRGGPMGYGGGRGGPIGPPWGRGYPAASLQQVECWYYKDAIGNVQGPCNVVKLLEWHKAGLFTANMQVRHVDSSEYIALCDAVDLRTGEVKVVPVRRMQQDNDSLEMAPPTSKEQLDPLASLSRDTAQLERLVEEERLRLRQQRSMPDAAPDRRPPPIINEPTKMSAPDPKRTTDANGPMPMLPFGGEAERMGGQFQGLRVSTGPSAPSAPSPAPAPSPVSAPGQVPAASTAVSAPAPTLQAQQNSFSSLPGAGRGFGRGIPRSAPGAPPAGRPQDSMAFPMMAPGPGILTASDALPPSSSLPPAPSDLGQDRDPAIVGMGNQINVAGSFGLMGLPPPESLGLPPDTPPDIVKAAIVAGMRPVQPVMPPKTAGVSMGPSAPGGVKEMPQPPVNFAWQMPTAGATRMVAVPSKQLELVDIDPMKEFSSPVDKVAQGDAMAAWPKLNMRNEEAKQLEERRLAEESSRREEMRRFEEAQRAERMMEERRAEEARARMEAQRREEEAKRTAQQESEREMMRQKQQRELERQAPAVGRGRGRGFAPPAEGNSVHAQTARLKALAEAKALAALEAEAQMKVEVTAKTTDMSGKGSAPAPSQAPWAAAQQAQKQVKSMQEVMEEEEREARRRMQEEERQRKLQAESRKNEPELGAGGAWGGAVKPPSLQEVMEEEEREARRRKEEQERQRKLQAQARKNEPELGAGGPWGGAVKPPSLQEVMEEEARAAAKQQVDKGASKVTPNSEFPSLGSSWATGTSAPQEKAKGGARGGGAMARTEQAAAAADLSQSNSAHAQVARMRAQADAKALEEVMRAQEEEKQRALKAKKQQEAAESSRGQWPKEQSAGWSKGGPGGKNRPLSLAEIQEQEMREKQEKMARKQAEVQEGLRSQPISAQAAASGAWGKGAMPVKSLAQIQEEEAARAQREAELQRKRREEESMGSGSSSLPSGAWASKAAARPAGLDAPPQVEQAGGGGGVWSNKAGGVKPSVPPPAAPAVSSSQGAGRQEDEDEDDLFWDFKGKPDKAAATSATSKDTGKEGGKGKGGKGKEGDSFSKWCFKELEKLTGSDDTTLGEFLMSLHSSSDVQEYVEEYLGPKGRSFAEEFVLRKQMDSVEVVSSRGGSKEEANLQAKKKKK